MPRTNSLTSVCALLTLVAVGCPRPTASQMRTRGEIGVKDDQTVQVDEKVFLCPHLVTIDGKEFKTSEARLGESSGAFGPMVPCGTVITQRGLCPSCKNPVHLPGERPVAYCPNLYFPETAPSDGALLEDRLVVQCDQELGEEGAHRSDCPKCGEKFGFFENKARITEPRISVEAVPAFRSPYSPDKAIDPVAVMLKGSEAPGEGKGIDRFDSNQDPYTKRYFEFEPSDVLEVIDHVNEVVEPIKETPVDPTYNFSPVGGTYRIVTDVIGPCWRCGGVKVCPDCGGSGNGPTGIYGPNQPGDCWACSRLVRDTGGAASPKSLGRCPECDDQGFVRYEGSLPTNFAFFIRREGALVAAESKARNWQHPAQEGGSGGGGSDAPPSDAPPGDAPPGDAPPGD